MGKNAQKQATAFNSAVGKRTELLEKINKCESLERLRQLENDYKTKSQYQVSAKVSKNLSTEKQKTLTDLGIAIKDAFEMQKNALTAGLAQPEVVLSVSSENPSLVDEGIDVESPPVQQSPFQELRRTTIAHIEAELVNVAKKCERMSKKGPAYEKATLATRNIHREITNLVEQYVQDGDVHHFQDQTKALFDETSEDMKTINEHRGWAKNFFGNLAFFILGVGVGYAAVCAYRGKFFEFNTDTANVVGAVNEKISALSIS